ncbi:hypothetical protein NFI96_020197 [Prochilodus magdalenae]|nr:hypothetical protein NFI96_020197 [Prochilodus magdalenae]
MLFYSGALHKWDLLFNQVYSRLVENSVAKGVFLESLEPYILSERIGCLTAPVMRDLLSYFQENGMMESVEGCLVHMDITNLDIQQVVQMCWDNQLYDAMIYVFNSGMNDYISPMEKLFQVIGPPLHEGKPLTDEQVTMGNKLLVYISCCLAGRAYPLGDIPEDLVPQVKNQKEEILALLQWRRYTTLNWVNPSLAQDVLLLTLFKAPALTSSEISIPISWCICVCVRVCVCMCCVHVRVCMCVLGGLCGGSSSVLDLKRLLKRFSLKPRNLQKTQTRSHTVFEFLIRLHSVEATQEEEVYPYIRTLLHFDTREFLNVLALTFEDFKNDKQALEYQHILLRIVGSLSVAFFPLFFPSFFILLKVTHFPCA